MAAQHQRVGAGNNSSMTTATTSSTGASKITQTSNPTNQNNIANNQNGSNNQQQNSHILAPHGATAPQPTTQQSQQQATTQINANNTQSGPISTQNAPSNTQNGTSTPNTLQQVVPLMSSHNMMSSQFPPHVQYLDVYRKISGLVSTSQPEFQELSASLQNADSSLKLEFFLYILQLVDIHDPILVKTLVNQSSVAPTPLPLSHRSVAKIELLRRLIQNCNLDWFRIVQLAYLPQQQLVTDSRFRYPPSVTTFPDNVFVVLFRLFSFSPNFQLWSILALLMPYKQHLSTLWLKEAFLFLQFFCHPEHLAQIHQAQTAQSQHYQQQNATNTTATTTASGANSNTNTSSTVTAATHPPHSTINPVTSTSPGPNPTQSQQPSQPPQPIVYDTHWIQLLELISKFSPTLIRPQTRTRYYRFICHYFPTVRQHLSAQIHEAYKLPPTEAILLPWVAQKYPYTPVKHHYLIHTNTNTAVTNPNPPLNNTTTTTPTSTANTATTSTATAQPNPTSVPNSQQVVPRRLVELILEQGGSAHLDSVESISAAFKVFTHNCDLLLQQQHQQSQGNKLPSPPPTTITEADLAPLLAIMFRTQHTLYQATSLITLSEGHANANVNLANNNNPSAYPIAVQQQLQTLFSMDPHVWKFYGDRLVPYKPWDFKLWIPFLNSNFAINWGLLFKLLDQPEMFIPDTASLESMFEVWTLALTTLPSQNAINLHSSLHLTAHRFPVEFFIGTWRCSAGQLSIIKALQSIGGAHPMIDWAATPGTTSSLPLEDWPYQKLSPVQLPNPTIIANPFVQYLQTPIAQQVLGPLNTQQQYKRVFGMYYNHEAVQTLISLCEVEVDIRLDSGAYALSSTTQRSLMLWPLLHLPLNLCPEVLLFTLIGSRTSHQLATQAQLRAQQNSTTGVITPKEDNNHLLTPFGTSVFSDFLDFLISSFVGHSLGPTTTSTTTTATATGNAVGNAVNQGTTNTSSTANNNVNTANSNANSSNNTNNNNTNTSSNNNSTTTTPNNNTHNNTLQPGTNLISALLPPHLSSTALSSVYNRLAKEAVNELTIALCQLYDRDRSFLPRLLEIVNDVKDNQHLKTYFSVVRPEPLCIDFVILASKKKLMPLDVWLRHRIETDLDAYQSFTLQQQVLLSQHQQVLAQQLTPPNYFFSILIRYLDEHSAMTIIANPSTFIGPTPQATITNQSTGGTGQTTNNTQTNNAQNNQNSTNTTTSTSTQSTTLLNQQISSIFHTYQSMTFLPLGLYHFRQQYNPLTLEASVTIYISLITVLVHQPTWIDQVFRSLLFRAPYKVKIAVLTSIDKELLIESLLNHQNFDHALIEEILLAFYSIDEAPRAMTSTPTGNIPLITPPNPLSHHPHDQKAHSTTPTSVMANPIMGVLSLKGRNAMINNINENGEKANPLQVAHLHQRSQKQHMGTIYHGINNPFHSHFDQFCDAMLSSMHNIDCISKPQRDNLSRLFIILIKKTVKLCYINVIQSTANTLSAMSPTPNSNSNPTTTTTAASHHGNNVNSTPSGTPNNNTIIPPSQSYMTSTITQNSLLSTTTHVLPGQISIHPGYMLGRFLGIIMALAESHHDLHWYTSLDLLQNLKHLYDFTHEVNPVNGATTHSHLGQNPIMATSGQLLTTAQGGCVMLLGLWRGLIKRLSHLLHINTKLPHFAELLELILKLQATNYYPGQQPSLGNIPSVFNPLLTPNTSPQIYNIFTNPQDLASPTLPTIISTLQKNGGKFILTNDQHEPNIAFERLSSNGFSVAMLKGLGVQIANTSRITSSRVRREIGFLQLYRSTPLVPLPAVNNNTTGNNNSVSVGGKNNKNAPNNQNNLNNTPIVLNNQQIVLNLPQAIPPTLFEQHAYVLQLMSQLSQINIPNFQHNQNTGGQNAATITLPSGLTIPSNQLLNPILSTNEKDLFFISQLQKHYDTQVGTLLQPILSICGQLDGIHTVTIAHCIVNICLPHVFPSSNSSSITSPTSSPPQPATQANPLPVIPAISSSCTAETNALTLLTTLRQLELARFNAFRHFLARYPSQSLQEELHEVIFAKFALISDELLATPITSPNLQHLSLPTPVQQYIYAGLIQFSRIGIAIGAFCIQLNAILPLQSFDIRHTIHAFYDRRNLIPLLFFLHGFVNATNESLVYAIPSPYTTTILSLLITIKSNYQSHIDSFRSSQAPSTQQQLMDSNCSFNPQHHTQEYYSTCCSLINEIFACVKLSSDVSLYKPLHTGRGSPAVTDTNTHNICITPSLTQHNLRPPNVTVVFQGHSLFTSPLLPPTHIQYLSDIIAHRITAVTRYLITHHAVYNSTLSHAPQHLNPHLTIQPGQIITQQQTPVPTITAQDSLIFQTQSPTLLLSPQLTNIPQTELSFFYPDYHRFALAALQLSLLDIVLCALSTTIQRTQMIFQQHFGTIRPISTLSLPNGQVTPTGQPPRPVVIDKTDIHTITLGLLTEQALAQRIFLHAKAMVTIEPLKPTDAVPVANNNTQVAAVPPRPPAHIAFYQQINPTNKDKPIILIPYHLLDYLSKAVANLNIYSLQRRLASLLSHFALQVGYKHSLYMFSPTPPQPTGALQNGGISTQTMLAHVMVTQQQMYAQTLVPMPQVTTTPSLSLFIPPNNQQVAGGQQQQGGGNLPNHPNNVVQSGPNNMTQNGPNHHAQQSTAQQPQQPQQQHAPQQQQPRFISIKEALLPYIPPQHRANIDLFAAPLTALTTPPITSGVVSDQYYTIQAQQFLQLLQRFSVIPVEFLVRYVLYHLIDVVLALDIQPWLDYQLSNQKNSLSQVIAAITAHIQPDSSDPVHQQQLALVDAIVAQNPGLVTNPNDISTDPDKIAPPFIIIHTLELVRVLLSTLLRSSALQNLQNTITTQHQQAIQNGTIPHGTPIPSSSVQSATEFTTRFIYGICYLQQNRIETCALLVTYFIHAGIITYASTDEILSMISPDCHQNPLHDRFELYLNLVSALTGYNPLPQAQITLNQQLYCLLTNTQLNKVPIPMYYNTTNANNTTTEDKGVVSASEIKQGQAPKIAHFVDSTGKQVELSARHLEYIDLLRQYNPPIISLTRLPRTFEVVSSFNKLIAQLETNPPLPPTTPTNNNNNNTPNTSNTQLTPQLHSEKLSHVISILNALHSGIASTTLSLPHLTITGPSLNDNHLNNKARMGDWQQPVAMSNRAFAQMQAGQVIIIPNNTAIPLHTIFKSTVDDVSTNNNRTPNNDKTGDKNGPNSDKNKKSGSTTTPIPNSSQQKTMLSIYRTQRELLRVQNAIPVGVFAPLSHSSLQSHGLNPASGSSRGSNNDVSSTIVRNGNAIDPLSVDGFVSHSSFFPSNAIPITTSVNLPPQPGSILYYSAQNRQAPLLGSLNGQNKHPCGNLAQLSRDFRTNCEHRDVVCHLVDTTLGQTPYELIIQPHSTPLHYAMAQQSAQQGEGVQNGQTNEQQQPPRVLYNTIPNLLPTTHAIIAAPLDNPHIQAPLSILHPYKMVNIAPKVNCTSLHTMATINHISTLLTTWFSLYLDPQATDTRYSLFAQVLSPPQSIVLSSLYHFHHFSMVSLYMMTLLVVQHPKFNSYVVSVTENAQGTTTTQSTSSNTSTKKSNLSVNNITTSQNGPNNTIFVNNVAPPPSFGVILQQPLDAITSPSSTNNANASSTPNNNNNNISSTNSTNSSNINNANNNSSTTTPNTTTTTTTVNLGQSNSTSSIVNNFVAQILPTHLFSLVKSNAISITHLYNGYIALILFICQHPALPMGAFGSRQEQRRANLDQNVQGPSTMTQDVVKKPTSPSNAATMGALNSQNDPQMVIMTGIGDDLISNQGFTSSLSKGPFGEPGPYYTNGGDFQARVKLLRTWCFALVEQVRVASTITNDSRYSYNTLFSYHHHHPPATNTSSTTPTTTTVNNNTSKNTKAVMASTLPNSPQNGPNGSENLPVDSLTPTFYPPLFGTFLSTLLTALHYPNVPSLKDLNAINSQNSQHLSPSTTISPTSNPTSTSKSTVQNTNSAVARIPLFDLSNKDVLMVLNDTLYFLTPPKYPLFFGSYIDLISHPALLQRLLSNPLAQTSLYYYFYHLFTPALFVAKTLAPHLIEKDDKMQENLTFPALPPPPSSNTAVVSTDTQSIKDSNLSPMPTRLHKPVYRALCRLATILNQDYPAALSEFSSSFSIESTIPSTLPQLRNILLSTAPVMSLIPLTVTSYGTVMSLSWLQQRPNLLRLPGLSPLLPPINSFLLEYPLDLLVDNPQHKDLITRFNTKYQGILYQPIVEYFSQVHHVQQQHIKAYHQQQQQQQQPGAQPPSQQPPSPTPIFPTVILAFLCEDELNPRSGGALADGSTSGRTAILSGNNHLAGALAPLLHDPHGDIAIAAAAAAAQALQHQQLQTQQAQNQTQTGSNVPSGGYHKPFVFTPTTTFDSSSTLIFLFYAISLGMPQFLQAFKAYQGAFLQQQQATVTTTSGTNNSTSPSNANNTMATNGGSMFYLVSSNPTTELLVKLFEVLPQNLRLSFLNIIISLLQWPSQTTFFVSCFLVYLFHRAYYGSLALQQSLVVEAHQTPWLAPYLSNNTTMVLTSQQMQSLDPLQQQLITSRHSREQQSKGLLGIVEVVLAALITRLSSVVNLPELPYKHHDLLPSVSSSVPPSRYEQSAQILDEMKRSEYSGAGVEQFFQLPWGLAFTSRIIFTEFDHSTLPYYTSDVKERIELLNKALQRLTTSFYNGLGSSGNNNNNDTDSAAIPTPKPVGVMLVAKGLFPFAMSTPLNINTTPVTTTNSSTSASVNNNNHLPSSE